MPRRRCPDLGRKPDGAFLVITIWPVVVTNAAENDKPVAGTTQAKRAIAPGTSVPFLCPGCRPGKDGTAQNGTDRKSRGLELILKTDWGSLNF